MTISEPKGKIFGTRGIRIEAYGWLDSAVLESVTRLRIEILLWLQAWIQICVSQRTTEI